MRMDDIQVDGVYRAKVGYRRSAKVRVIETRVGYELGRRRRTDGVRVQLEEPVSGFVPWAAEREHAAGTEFVATSRDIERAWTQEDQDALEAERALEARQSRVEELLRRAGYVHDGYDAEARDFVEGSFAWRGEWLEVRGELLDRLLGLLADDASIDRGVV